MKRFFSILIMCAIMLNGGIISVHAKSVDNEETWQRLQSYADEVATTYEDNEVVNLNGAEVAVSFAAPAGAETASPKCYVTNTREMTINLKSSRSITVKVTLYDTDGNRIGGETKDLGIWSTVPWTFPNLSQNITYYFTVKNLGQRDVTVSGTVSD